MRSPIYITTTLPYVNADPHIGFALEFIYADIYARSKALQGHDVFFNTGTDEHGLKIFRKAKELGKDTKAYVDEYAAKFRELAPLLGIANAGQNEFPHLTLNFIRTTDAHHKMAAQEFWRKCAAACDDKGQPYIYKKAYKVKYCVGCELEKTDSELVDGLCPIHPNLVLEAIEEENYFFRFSSFTDKLLTLYKTRRDFVVPQKRFNEIQSFVERGLEDFSISRIAEKMPWGIPVPGDEAQVMYVWFDALVDYISAIGWPDDNESFSKWWATSKDGKGNGLIQFAGKDQVRQQAAMWQAMLMAAGINPSQQIVIHGFLTNNGQKMSKSLGNVVNPIAVIDAYRDVAGARAVDVFRYFMAREIDPFEDGDFSMERLNSSYNANLANGLGNLVSRIMKMVETNGITNEFPENEEYIGNMHIDTYEFKKAIDSVWEKISELDKRIQEEQPFKVIKAEKEKGEKMVKGLWKDLYSIAVMLLPFMPTTANDMIACIKSGKSPKEALFKRKEQ
jgi:methionyl-tRNA synthetase